MSNKINIINMNKFKKKSKQDTQEAEPIQKKKKEYMNVLGRNGKTKYVPANPMNSRCDYSNNPHYKICAEL